jgi:hypothetical protein
MDSRDSEMEAADPSDHFESNAEICVELRDQVASAASEFLRKSCQIEVIRRLLEYPL